MQTASPPHFPSSLPKTHYPMMVSPQSTKSMVGPTLPPNKLVKNSTNNDVDLRRLILLNLPNDLVREYLELYVEHLSGETEIERIDYSNLDETTIMVTFKTELDMADVRRRHNTRSTLNDSEISLAEVMPSATVMIRNLPNDISRDVLELYFSNRRRSDGGQVIDVSIDPEHQQALLTFADHQDAKRVSVREHSLHGQQLDVRIYHQYMGVEPFIDASTISRQPEPIIYRAVTDSRYLVLLKNRSLLEKLRDQVHSISADMHIADEESFEIFFNGSRCTLHQRSNWSKDVEKIVNRFVNEHILVHKIPWNNSKIPSINSDQLYDLSAKDRSRIFRLISMENQSDQIVITSLKDQLDRSLSELTDMLTALTVSNQNIPLNDAVYRSKAFAANRDVKVEQHRSSLLLRSNSPKSNINNVELLYPPPYTMIDDYLENLRLFQLDLLSMRFIDLARRTYRNISIDVDRTGRRVHIHGLADQVIVCKNYFQSILDGIVQKHYKIGKDMGTFLSNPDTVEIIIGNFTRMEHVCAYEIERNPSHHRKDSPSPTFSSRIHSSTSANSHASSTNNLSHHKLIIYSLTRDYCDRIYDLLRQDVRVSSIMLDKDDRRCLTDESWNTYVRDLYSTNGGGFRRRRVLLQVRQNQLTFVGFEQDVNSMRKHVHDYFMENAISFYESD